MTLVISKVFTYDTDAGNYIQAVEAADQADTPGIGALEPATRQAINNFVIGCKQDGIWNAIKVGCILAGAKTLEGSFIDLKSATKLLVNNGFADGTYSGSNYTTGDYDRKTGLKGSGTKYLDSNRLDNDDPQDSFHMSGYVTTTPLGSANTFLMGGVTTGTNRGSFIYNGSGSMIFHSRNSTATISAAGAGGSSGLVGQSRSGPSTTSGRVAGVSYSNTAQNSQTRATHKQFVFCRSVDGVASSYTAARVAFYSIGESLDLALLDTRVTALINAFAAAIP